MFTCTVSEVKCESYSSPIFYSVTCPFGISVVATPDYEL